MTALLDRLTITTESGEEYAQEIGEEYEQEYAQDPVPDEKPAPRPARKAARTVTAAGKARSTKALAREVAEDLAGLIEIVGVAIGFRCDECGDAVEQQAKPMADAVALILSRNPRLLEAFASAPIVEYTMGAAALGRAVKPIIQTVAHHHEHGDDSDAVDLAAFPVPR